MDTKPPGWCRAVKKSMIDRGMSVRQLAEETGYCTSTISMVINGRYSSGRCQEIMEKIDSVLGETLKLPPWYRDVKNAMHDQGVSVRQLAGKTGYSITTVSNVINGHYSRRSYQTVAEKINSILGTEGMPQRIYAPSDEWCQSVKIGLVKKNMSITRLAEAAGVTRDKMSLVVNGRVADQQVVNTVSHLLGIALPEASSGMPKL